MRNRDRFIESRGAHLRVREAGAGRVIAFIHGWALDSEMWMRQLEGLASEYRIVAYDRRGFGASSGMPSIAADVVDLGRVLEALSIERAAIVGMSQGARVAALYAAANPDRITQVILDGPPALLPDEHPAQPEIRLERYRDLIREHGPDAFAREWLEHPLTRLHTRDVGARALLERIAARYPARDLLAPVSESMPPPIDLQSLMMPVLIINGACDLDSRHASGRRLEQALSTARRVLVPAAGHIPCLDNPTFYNDTLRSFLEHARGVGFEHRNAFGQKENRS